MSVVIFGFLGTDIAINYPLLVPNVKVLIGTNLKEPSNNLTFCLNIFTYYIIIQLLYHQITKRMCTSALNIELKYTYASIKNTLPNLDTLINVERMRVAIQVTKTYRRMNSPDGYSLMLIDNFINHLRVEGFTEEEIRYAVKRTYMKRTKKYESKDQYTIP
jgi:hypothetical protein